MYVEAIVACTYFCAMKAGSSVYIYRIKQTLPCTDVDTLLEPSNEFLQPRSHHL